jgi:hypothetical protein
MISEQDFGKLIERTENLVKSVDEFKQEIKDFHERVDDKFKDLKNCVNDKFDRHNDFHINQGKKYTKLFLVVGALALGGLIANPEGLVIALKFLLRIF